SSASCWGGSSVLSSSAGGPTNDPHHTHFHCRGRGNPNRGNDGMRKAKRPDAAKLDHGPVLNIPLGDVRPPAAAPTSWPGWCSCAWCCRWSPPRGDRLLLALDGTPTKRYGPRVEGGQKGTKRERERL